MGSRRPLWRALQERVHIWRQLGALEFICRAIQFGVFDKPAEWFTPGQGVYMGEIPQDAEYILFSLEDIKEGCRTGMYQKISRGQAMKAKGEVEVVSSSFTTWKETEEGKNGMFIVNQSVQSKYCNKGSVKMEMLTDFESSITRGDYMMSMDIVKGYRLLRLHPAMRDWFIFIYEGEYYQYITFRFGWGCSPLLFTEVMRTFMQERRSYGYRVLSHVDDFLIIPALMGSTATPMHCAATKRKIDSLMAYLGTKRHPDKGCWEGAQVVQHLGVLIDTLQMKLFVTKWKQQKVRGMVSALLRQVWFGKRHVDASLLYESSFCGACVALMLAMPWVCFYTRSLYWYISRTIIDKRKLRCHLSHQSIRDVKFWKSLSDEALDRRHIHQQKPLASMRADATDVGYGGTLNTTYLTAGAKGMPSDQGIWGWKDRG